MAFKRIYSIESNIPHELFVEVLVSCSNCGEKDIITDTGVEHATDSFVNSESIDDCGECSLCGNNKWNEIGEFVTLSTPKPNDSYDSLSQIINYNNELMKKYEKLYHLGFSIQTHTEDKINFIKNINLNTTDLIS